MCLFCTCLSYIFSKRKEKKRLISKRECFRKIRRGQRGVVGRETNFGDSYTNFADDDDLNHESGRQIWATLGGGISTI